ncbi:MAG TPA: DMT family transporter, partial [Devosia sp.]|nr:DMT family transporter [Devosia sp.]
GIGLVLGAFLVFTWIDSSAKWLGLAGLPVIQIVFMRYAGSLVIVSAISLPRQGAGILRSANFGLEVLRALALLGSSLCNLTAVQYLPLTVTSSISFTMPLILCALSVPLLGEQVGWRRWTAIAVGFVGILIIVQPGTNAFHPAALLCVAATFFSAFYFLLTRRLAGVDSTATQQFYGNVIATVALAPFALANWVWPTRPIDWAVFLFIGLVGYGGHQFSTIAHRYAPASTLAPFAYSQIVFMTLASWLIFGQPPDIWLYIGAPIVIGSGLYIWLRERALARPVTPIMEEH